MILINR